MRTYTAKQLLATYAWACEHPQGIIPIDRMEHLTGAAWLRWFRRCLDNKVSRGLIQTGRKWDQLWQIEAQRTARAVNTPRLAVHWVPVEFRQRLQHRLSTDS